LQRYLTVVVDDDTGKLVWAHPGRDRKTTDKFLDLLGQERLKRIKLVSCDDADWITRPVTERCPNAIVCLDPFHIVKAPPTHWTRSAARSGTRHGAKARPNSRASSKAPVRTVEEPRERGWSGSTSISCSQPGK
jgi:transposase